MTQLGGHDEPESEPDESEPDDPETEEPDTDDPETEEPDSEPLDPIELDGSTEGSCETLEPDPDPDEPELPLETLDALEPLLETGGSTDDIVD